MQVLVDLTSHLLTATPSIVQVDRAPVSTSGIPINGKYLLPIPPGLEVPVTSASYILPIDGGDVTSQAYARLLASMPMFENVYFNSLLTATDLADIDLLATFKDSEPPYDPPNPPQYFPTRCQIGRPGGGPTAGQMPTHTAILPNNASVTPNHPGVLVTQDIDISAYTGPAGTDEFLCYWQLYSFATSADVATSMNGGANTPAIRTYTESDPEPMDFSVYLSLDSGVNWCPVGSGEPLSFFNKSTTIRLAFVNRSRAKLYLASFAVLF